MPNPITQLEQITINSKSKSFLSEIAKWCFFFSILGFISIVFLVVVGILMGTLYAPMMDMLGQQQGMPINFGVTMLVIYLVSAALTFFPVLYLFKFSRKMKIALSTKNDDELADAFEMLKSHFKFVGVFTIITISIYVFLILFSVFAGSMV